MSKRQSFPESESGNNRPTRSKSKTSLSRSRRHKHNHEVSTLGSVGSGVTKRKDEQDKTDHNRTCKARVVQGIQDDQSSFINDSPLDASKEDPDNDDLAGLKFCSQENTLDKSGDSDAQCEVHWDCYSPDTVKQLRKLRGQYNVEGVKRIVENFNDDHVKPQKTNTLNLMPVPGPGPSTAFKEVSFPHSKRPQRRPQRVTNHKAVQEMILLLQGRVAKQEEGTEAAKAIAEKLPSTAADKGGDKVDNDEDCWSDDDLFQDNSFLIEATQNPEKFINTCYDASTAVNSYMPKSSHLDKGLSTASGNHMLNADKSVKSLSPDTSFIPASCAPKQVNVMNRPAPLSSMSSRNKAGPQPSKPPNATSLSNQGNGVGRIQPFQQVQSHTGTKHALFSSNSKTFTTSTSKTSGAYNAKFTSSVNKFANQNLQKQVSNNTIIQNSQQYVPQNSQRIIQLPQGAKVKTSFRKFNSFQVDNRSQAFKNTNSALKNQSPSSALNSSFKRTMSFDSSPSVINAKSSTSGPTRLLSSQNRPFSVQRDSKSAPHKGSGGPIAAPPVQKNSNPTISKPEVGVSSAATDDGFDISLSEDVLQQLLEVDEVFDSQADILATGQPTVRVSTSSSSSLPRTSPASRVSTPSSSSLPRTSPASPSCMNGLKPLRTKTSLSLMAPKACSVGSLKSSTPVRPFKHRTSLLEPNSSTPVKLARAGNNKDSSASDSGTELFDSFLNEEMYETQILPFLEKIESETTLEKPGAAEIVHPATLTACPPPRSTSTTFSSPIKCSPEEIEQKRQAALERRSLRLSQRSKKTTSR